MSSTCHVFSLARGLDAEVRILANTPTSYVSKSTQELFLKEKSESKNDF